MPINSFSSPVLSLSFYLSIHPSIHPSTHYPSIHVSIFFRFFLYLSFIRTVTFCTDRYVFIHCCPLILFVLNSHCSVSYSAVSFSFPLSYRPGGSSSTRDRTNAIYLSYFLSSVLAILRMVDHPSPPIRLASKFSYTYIHHTVHLSSTCPLTYVSSFSRSFSRVCLFLAFSYTPFFFLSLSLLLSRNLCVRMRRSMCARLNRAGAVEMAGSCE